MDVAGPNPVGRNSNHVIFQQNMALTPSLLLPNGDNLYRGSDRAGSLESLLSFLEWQQPVLVGLSEVWVPEERQLILDRLGYLYPYYLQGPGQATEQTLDGGLLLLCRHPFETAGSWVYQACLGEDCLCQKGILHARLQLEERGAMLDIFLTHLQNPTPLMEQPNVGPGKDGRAKVEQQLEQLVTFIRRQRYPGYPALLLGDLNTDGGLELDFEEMLVRLDQPADLWLATKQESPPVSGDSPTFSPDGLTFDEASTFSLTVAPGPAAAERFLRGKRLDYFLSYPGSQWLACYENTQIINLESSPGRDSSDHYGLMTELVEIKRL